MSWEWVVLIVALLFILAFLFPLADAKKIEAQAELERAKKDTIFHRERGESG